MTCFLISITTVLTLVYDQWNLTLSNVYALCVVVVVAAVVFILLV